jgi:SAM-dependent methyltransferase
MLAGTRKGWFTIPGIQTGDRTLAQQLKGLTPALYACERKSILDLGCAEGLVAYAFAERGARRVRGYDVVPAAIQRAIAFKQDSRYAMHASAVDFRVDNVERLAGLPPELFAVDFVLALAILHKLKDPRRAARWIAKVAGELVVVRLPKDTPGFVLDERSGLVHHDISSDLGAGGFFLDRVERGSFEEWTGYYRRSRS